MLLDITLLIFSRNDTDKVRALISDLRQIVSEIVIFDSSNCDEHREFESWIKTVGSSKIKLYYIVPLGYPDMLRPYALSKCSNEWVLLLDADEKISTSLKEDLKEILDTDQSDVFGIFRYPAKSDGTKIGSSRSEQVRIFKKGYLDEKGLIHQLPRSKGRYVLLPEKYYILHLINEKANRNSEYNKLDRFSRYSYGNLPKRIRWAIGLLNLGQVKRLDKELSLKDYFVFYFSKEVYSGIVTRNLLRVLKAPTFAFRKAREFIEFKSSENSLVDFEISKIINRIGIVDFLNLDKEDVVEEINKTYLHGELLGSDLLIFLLRKRYSELMQIQDNPSTV